MPHSIHTLRATVEEERTRLAALERSNYVRGGVGDYDKLMRYQPRLFAHEAHEELMALRAQLEQVTRERDAARAERDERYTEAELIHEEQVMWSDGHIEHRGLMRRVIDRIRKARKP